jgi:hypothetical protein
MPPAKPPDYLADILRRFDSLSDDAVVPVGAAAVLHGVSDKTIAKNYPTVRLSAKRIGVRVGDLRHISRGEKPPT